MIITAAVAALRLFPFSMKDKTMPELGEINEVEVIKSDGTRTIVKLMTIGIKRDPKPPEPQEPATPAQPE